VVLRSDMPLAESELAAGEDLSDDAPELVDLTSITAAAGVGDGAGAGAVAVAVGVTSVVGVSATGARNEWLRVSGARTFFSLIVRTIFSRSSGVM
jgi:hypothetical protein